jgi:TonB family protein
MSIMTILAFAGFLATVAGAAHPRVSAARPGRTNAIPVAQLKPMLEKDIRLAMPGCLDEGPIPADGGRLCFLSDGHAVMHSGWGNKDWHYIIFGNKIVITIREYSEDKRAHNFALSFYKDSKGKPYYRYDGRGASVDAHPLRMVKLLEPQPPPQTSARKVRPMGNTASWISEDDYPFDGQAERHRGTVTYSLQVNSDGRVAGCSVSHRSGYANLDRATCRLVVRRGRFSPALDATGRPIASAYSGHVAW